MIGIKSKAVLLFRRFITSKTRPLTTRNLHPENVLNDDTDERVEARASKPVERLKTSKDMEEVYQYFKDTNFLEHFDTFPLRLIKQRKSIPELLYLVDNNVAKDIVDLIKDDLIIDPQKVVETNAGLGIMTEKLIHAGVPLVRVMEPMLKFVQTLANLQLKYSYNIRIHQTDLLQIWKIAHQDKQDGGGRVAALFTDIPCLKWDDDLGLKIIGTVTNINFIRHVILDVVRQCGLVSYGRPCFYLCIPPSIWTRLTSNNTDRISEYRNTSLLFQLLFDYRLLGQVPRKAFLPWMPSYDEKNIGNVTNKNKVDKDHMLLVKIEGKKNLFTEIIDEKYMHPLWYFINHHMVTRTGRVIPHMETWQPGCGPSLIMQDFNIFTQFGDLNPEKVLNLFKEFVTWDGFQNSFMPSMDNSPQKMEQLLF